MDDDIPPLRRPEDMPPVRTQVDLYLHWRALMGKLGFSKPSLWILFFDAYGYVAPVIPQIEDIPEVPDFDMLEKLMEFCQEVLDDFAPGGSVAFLRSRPGRGALNDSDRAWGARLPEAARSAGINCHPVHLANDYTLKVFTADDAIASI